MSKDIIYIDNDDDITSIIGKLKKAKEKVVALVPPKRVGILQSAVNLKLLKHAAEKADKSLVLVTQDKSLIALTATSKIPVAKNLQSKPEIAQLDAPDLSEKEEVIEGAALPVGELVKTTKYDEKPVENDIEEDIASINIDDDDTKYYASPDAPKDSTEKAIKATGEKTFKIPNFSTFRKKLFLVILALGLLVYGIVWAAVIAPSAKVYVTTKTSTAYFDKTLSLVGSSATDINKSTISTISKQLKQDMSVTFSATGQQDVGNKATGTITLTNCDTPQSIAITAGTVFTANSNGAKYVSTSGVTLPGLQGSANACINSGSGGGTASVNVQAVNAGTSSNIGATDYDISGVSGYIYARGGAMTGGTTRISTVVSNDDLLKAKQALADLSTDSYKAQLKNQFSDSEVVITCAASDGCFKIDRADAVPSVAVGAEATGPVKLTSATTFTMTAIPKSELLKYFKDYLTSTLGKNQRIYSEAYDDYKNVKIDSYKQNDTTPTVHVSAQGTIGPDISASDVFEMVKGMRYGEAQSALESITGVSSADIKFSYFWVTNIPNDKAKVQVVFKK